MEACYQNAKSQGLNGVGGLPLFGFLHPPLEHRFNFMRTLRCDVQFLEPVVVEKQNRPHYKFAWTQPSD